MSRGRRAFGNIHCGGTVHQSLVVGGDENGMPVSSQLVEPATTSTSTDAPSRPASGSSQHQGRCGAGEGRQEASQNSDLSGLSLGEVRHHVVGTMRQVERFEKRLNVHRGTAHAHGTPQMFDDHFTAQHAVLLQNGAQREGENSSPSISIDDAVASWSHPPLFQRQETDSSLQ